MVEAEAAEETEEVLSQTPSQKDCDGDDEEEEEEEEDLLYRAVAEEREGVVDGSLP